MNHLVAAKIRLVMESWIASLPFYLQNEVRESYVVAGGAIASTFNNEEPRDYDVWISNPETLVKLGNYYLENTNATLEYSLAKKTVSAKSSILPLASPDTEILLTKNALTIIKYKVQLILAQPGVIFTSDNNKFIANLMNSFDFFHTQAWVSNDSFGTFSIMVEGCIRSKQLYYNYSNTGTNILNSIYRIAKYSKKGYKIDPEDMRLMITKLSETYMHHDLMTDFKELSKDS